MFTVFHLLAVLLPAMGAYYCASFLGSHWGPLGQLVGATLGLFVGLAVARTITCLAFKHALAGFAGLPTDKLRAQLLDDTYLAPNLIAVELARRGELQVDDLRYLCSQLSHPAFERRVRAWAAITSVRPDARLVIPAYNPGESPDDCKIKALPLYERFQ